MADGHEHCEQEDERQEHDDREVRCGNMHRKVLDKGDKPTVSIDYKAFGASEHDKIQMVVVKDESTGCGSAHVCEAKGAGDRWVVDRICDDIGLWDHTELIIKGDEEPALVQVQEGHEEMKIVYIYLCFLLV